MPPRKRLGQLLTELGVIDEHQLQSALGHQKQWGGKLGGILVQKGFCSEEAVVSALAKHLGMQSVRLADMKIDPRAVKCVSKQVAEKLHVFPYELSGSGRTEVVTIAMSDPTDLSAVDQLAFHTGKRVKPMLAGDGEIVAAIQAHYGGGEERKEPTDKVARPAPPNPPTVTPGTPAGSVAGFPRRIEPPAGPPAPAAAARGAPYIPPPIPAGKPAPPPQKLDEIEPEAAMAPPPAAPAVPPPVELPEDDAQDLGLEPIAAHSQFGGQVAGQEEVAGDGSAADDVEGLVSASVAHAAAGPGPQDPAAQGWGAPSPNSPAGLGDADWGQGPGPHGSTGWTGPIEAAAAGGWADPPASPPAAGGQVDWSAPVPASDSAWGVPQAEQVGESTSIALPTDAILGAVEEIGADPDAQGASLWGEDAAPAEPPAPAPPIDHKADPAASAPDHPPEAEAPDAWSSMDDPLAAGTAPPDPLVAETGPRDPLEGVSDAALEAAANAALEAAANAALEAASEAPLEATPGPRAWEDPEPPATPAVHRGHSKTQEFANPTAEEVDGGAAEVDVESAAAEQDAVAEEWRGQVQAPAEASAPDGSAGQLPFDGSTPLSPADLGALASIGVEPSDGVGALRLLAALVRILNRNQLIEPDDLRAEIHQSLAQGAAAAASQTPNGMESEGSTTRNAGSAGEPAET